LRRNPKRQQTENRNRKQSCEPTHREPTPALKFLQTQNRGFYESLQTTVNQDRSG
jgi:hypothetical protein